MDNIQQQIIYRSMVDTRYALDIFKNIPITDFDENEDLVTYIDNYYDRYQEPVTRETLLVRIEEDLKVRHKYTPELMQAWVKRVNQVTRLNKQDNYASSKAIKDSVDKWSRQRLAANLITKVLASSDGISSAEGLTKLMEGLNRITVMTSGASSLGEYVDLFDPTQADWRVEQLENMWQDLMPTGFRDLDALMDGGLGPGEMAMVVAKSGSGKAQPYSTPTPTPKGIVPFGSLKVGDYVYNRLGKPVKVTDIFEKGNLDVYEIKTADGRRVLANDDHLFSYWTKNAVKGRYLVTKSVREMMDTGLIRKLKSGQKCYRYSIPVSSAVEYPEQKLPLSPYTVGAYIGDGSLVGRFAYMSASEDKLTVLDRIVKENGWLCYKHNSQNNYTYTFKNAEGHIVKPNIFPVELQDYAGNKRIPEAYLQGSIEQRYALAQGLFDTDGCAHIRAESNTIKVDYSTTSPGLVTDIVNLMRSLGFKASTSAQDRRGGIHKSIEYSINVNGTMAMLKRLFTTKAKSSVFAKAKPIETYHDSTRIVSIKKLGYQEPMRCILVDDPEHLYVTQDYVVTHNTTVLVNLARNYVMQGKNVLYVALEERTPRMLVRLYQMLGQISKSDIFDQHTLKEKDFRLLDKALTFANKHHKLGDFILWRSRPRVVSPANLEEVVQQYILDKGHAPDVILVDYPDLMKNPYANSSTSEPHAAGLLYEELRRIADTYGSIMWTASQTNRQANIMDKITAYAIQGSAEKINACELIFTINQTKTEFEEGFVRFYIDKVRNPDTAKNYRDSMINLKVDTKSVTYRNETPEESKHHEDILMEEQSILKDKSGKARSKIDAINQALGGH